MLATVKKLLADPKGHIELHDAMVTEIQEIIRRFSVDYYPVNYSEPDTPVVYCERIHAYENALERLIPAFCAIGYWGRDEHIPLLCNILARVTDEANSEYAGSTALVALRSYPAILLTYAAGIGSIAAKKYNIFTTMLKTPVMQLPNNDNDELAFVLVSRYKGYPEIFKYIKGYENSYCPQSAYIFQYLQLAIDKLLFLGKSYETAFDELEALLFLVYADIRERTTQQVWAPAGRFVINYRFGHKSPLTKFTNEIANATDDWGPLKAGLFNGKAERFSFILEKYKTEVIPHLNWY